MTARLLHIIPTLDQGGAEKQLVLLASGLRARGWDMHVCTLTRSGPWAEHLAAAGVPLTNIGKSWKLDPGALVRLQRHLRALRPDLVHTWLFAANCYGRYAALRCGVKHLVASERCVDRWKVWHELAIDRYLARHTERIVTNSGGVTEFYAAQRIPADKFVVIPNGIEEDAAAPTWARDELLEQLQLPPNACLIGAVGRLWPQKRYKDLIFAAELLRVIRDDVHLLIIGDGPQRERLERFSRAMEVQEHVHWLGHRSDVGRLLGTLDCFWLGSGYEGQSNALMEAMLAGVPVVATDIPGNRDLVVPDVTGYLVPVGDRAAFARQTQRLLEDRDLARRLGAAGRDRMRTEFTVSRMVERHEALYRELLGTS